MIADIYPTFSIFLNSQATSNNATVLQGTAGEVRFTQNMDCLLPYEKRAKLYKISVNFYSKQVDHSVLDAINSTYYLEILTGNQIYNMYGMKNNNAITLPLERVNLLYNGTNSTDIYQTKQSFTSQYPSDFILVRIRNAATDAIATAFPNYCISLQYEPIYPYSITV